MKVDHALRDLYDHEQDLRLLILTEFVFIALTFVMLAVEEVGLAIVTLLVIILSWSLAQGSHKDGINRKLWQYASGGLNGVPLKEKRDALEDYTLTDESDLEDLER